MSSASSGDSSGFSRNNGGLNQTFCIDKTDPSISDLTDSNRGSSSNNSGSGSGGSGTRTGSGGSGTESGSGGSGSGGTGSKGSGSTEREPALVGPPQEAGVEEAEERTTSSISSDAAVASQKSSHDRHSELPQHNHMDVVFNTRKRKDRMNPPDAVTSTERSFKLDYEEVFDQSNIPQLIAGTSGKIVSWNQSFVNATGLEESDLERMTIFSLVQQDKLSSFFEIAATALRSDGDDDDACDEAESSANNDSTTTSTKGGSQSSQDESQTFSSSSNKENQRKWNYDALTLPCIEFPAMKEQRESSNKWDNIEKLNMTMILISDPDPRKRCFHCTFTDGPGTDGAMGIITPDLLAALYSNPEKLNLEQHPRYRRKHKRAKIQAAAATNQKPSNDK